MYGAIPVPRTNHAVAAVGKYFYVFGGNDTTKSDSQDYGTFGDFRVLDTGKLV